MRLLLAFKAFFTALANPKRVKALFTEKEEKKENDTVLLSHLRLLSVLQGSRFLDFIKEDISSYSDAQVGAAIRKIHADCGEKLEELVTIRPIMDDKEGTEITVPEDYNPQEIKLTGHPKGKPPFSGKLRHKGWRAHKLSLPPVLEEKARDVLCPAEVEVR